MLLELRFETLEKRKRACGAARKARSDAVLVQAPHFTRPRLDHDIAERDLAVAAERAVIAAPHRQYGGAVKRFYAHGWETRKAGDRVLRGRCGIELKIGAAGDYFKR